MFFRDDGASEGRELAEWENCSSESRSADEDEDGAAKSDVECRMRYGCFNDLLRDMRDCRKIVVDRRDW